VDPNRAKDGLGSVKTAIFGLLGLLIAFTFGGAVARYDKRRNMALREANAIAIAWDRLDTLPAQAQLPIRNGRAR
jgi:hypothetical protein